MGQIKEVSGFVLRVILDRKSNEAKGQGTLAKLNLYASQGMDIVNMERFDHLTSAVDCNDDDGVLSLTFISDEAYQNAGQIWTEATKNEEDKFLLIANHEGCGPADQRQPYIVSKVTQDGKDRITSLNAQPANWTSVASTYDVQFGKAVQNETSDLQRRGLLGCLTGTCTVPKSWPINIDLGKPNSPSNIYGATDGSFALDCTNCYAQGSFEVDGSISVKNYKLQDLSISATANKFNSILALKAKVGAPPKTPAAFGKVKEVISPVGIPDLGFSIGSFFSIGGTVAYEIGFNASIAGNATFDFGLNSTIPDGTKAVVDLSDQSKSNSGDFTGDTHPFFHVDEISASMALNVFSEPRVAFGIEAGDFKYDVAIGFKVPELIATLSTKYNQNGVCSDDSKHTKTGVELGLQAGVAVTAELDAHAGSGADNQLPNWSKNLFEKTWNLDSLCFPLDIPGLGPAASTTAAAPSNVSVSAISTIPASSAANTTVSIPNATPIRTGSFGLFPTGTGPFSSGYKGTASYPTGTAPYPRTSSGTAGFSMGTSASRSYSMPHASGARRLR